MSYIISNWLKKHFNEDNKGEIVQSAQPVQPVQTVQTVFEINPIVSKIIEKINKGEYEETPEYADSITIRFGETLCSVYLRLNANPESCSYVLILINTNEYVIDKYNQNELYKIIKDKRATARYRMAKEAQDSFERGISDILGTK